MASDEHKQATIFATESLADSKPLPGPLLVVGLPRSGSSMSADVLSQTGKFYVFDDLYAKNSAMASGNPDALTDEALKKFLYFLGWTIRSRLRIKGFALPDMTIDDVEPMNDALYALFEGTSPSWATVQKEWLHRLAHLNGCEGWGYNHPRSFMMLDELFAAYPDAKVLFLFRAADRVLASYKHMPMGHTDGDPRRYHPVLYSLYWRAAVRAYHKSKAANPASVSSVLFEDLIEDPSAALKTALGDLGVQFDEAVTLPEGNSSFGNKRRELNGLEISLLRLLAGSEAASLGYALPKRAIKPVGDMVELVKTTVTRVGFIFEERKKRQKKANLKVPQQAD